LSPLDLEKLITNARRRLPASHRALLDQIGVQDAVIDDWPGGVRALYQTIHQLPPDANELAGVLAAWLPGLRVVVYHGTLLDDALGQEDLTQRHSSGGDRQHRLARVWPRSERHPGVAGHEG